MEPGIEFCDSNIVVAWLVARHEHHAEAAARVDSIPAGHRACAAHSLAETFNTLTKSKGGYNVPPLDAIRLLDQVRSKFLLIALTPDETLEAIRSASRLGLAGPIIYDALLMACARKAGAIAIYSSNAKHFRKTAPDLASVIFKP